MKTSQFRALNLITLAFLGAVSCSTPEKKGPPRVDTPEAVAQQTEGLSGQEAIDYREALQLYSNRRYKQATQRLSQFIEKYPGSIRRSQSHNYLGLIHLHYRQFESAVQQFKSANVHNKDYEFKQYIQYNLATAYFENDELDSSINVLNEIDAKAVSDSTQIKMAFLQALILQRQEKIHQATDRLLSGSELLFDDQGKRRVTQRTYQSFQTRLERLLNLNPNVSSVESLYDDYKDNAMADHLLFRLGELQIQNGRSELGEAYLKTLTSLYPSSVHYHDAVELLRTAQTRSLIDAQAIGVLLPMSGRFARLGNQCFEGISLAFRIFNPELPDSRINLIIEDSGITEAESLAAVEKLFLTHHVSAIIGPLRSHAIEALTTKAQEFGVPLISLSQKGGTEGSFVFSAAVTARDQAYEIARYAIRSKGMRRFAILHPQGKFGDQYSQHFWDAVEELNGEIVGIENYPQKETDFRHPVDKLSGLHYTDARQREIKALEIARYRDNITKRNRKTEEYYRLPPVVDYDAVFIPDEPRALGQILPTFAYRDVDNVNFLGISTWNSKALVERAPKYAERAYFVDGFFKESDTAKNRQFKQLYQSTYGRLPTLFDAICYDAASVLDQVLVTSGANISRYQIQKKLGQVRNYPGVTGQISSRQNHFHRRLKVLTVRNKTIKEVTDRLESDVEDSGLDPDLEGATESGAG